MSTVLLVEEKNKITKSKKKGRNEKSQALKQLFVFLFTEPYYFSLFYLGERAKLTTSSVLRDWIQMEEELRRFSVHNKIQPTVLEQQRVWSGFERLATAVPRRRSSDFPFLLQGDVYKSYLDRLQLSHSRL